MALISRRNLRYLKLWLLSPIVEKILLVSYLIAIFLFLIYNNDYYGTLQRHTLRREAMEYFKYDKFVNITAIDKTQAYASPLNKVEYDFYDYLQFLLEDRLYQKERYE